MGQPARLPSSINSYKLITCAPGGVSGVFYDILQRAGLAALGLLAAGQPAKSLLRNALFVSTTIEIAVILYQAHHKHHKQPTT
tara:strand:+ start:2916 stop:3164 length:249 start_codon:yes stop_codon:yes gene_type:complete